LLSTELANEQNNGAIRQAAGLALKNAFTYRDITRLREVQDRWLQIVPADVKDKVRRDALQTLYSPGLAAASAAQLISSVAAIELPRGEWPDLMDTLVKNVQNSPPEQTGVKQSSLTTIGFICESDDSDLRDVLVTQSNAILTAVVTGAKKEEPNQDVRLAALNALSDATDFIRTNFEKENERNYIMQVVCEATQAPDTRVQAAAFGCLNRIMGIYYHEMSFYMQRALFGLTVGGMRSEEEDVAKLAIEFWCTVCEEEISIDDDNQQASQEGSTELRPFFQFARVASKEVVPTLLQLMSKVEEDDADDEYNVARAAYQCLQLFAQTIGGDVVPLVITFVEANIRSSDWKQRDAAVSSFGAIMDGPDIKILEPLIKQALPVLIQTMQTDSQSQVQDSSAYALSRICDYCAECIDPNEHLPQMMQALFQGLQSNPKIAASCCLALLNLTERFVGPEDSAENALTRYFEDSVKALLEVTAKPTVSDSTVRTAAYEVLGGFITNSATQSRPVVEGLTSEIIGRLGTTVQHQKQTVSIEEKLQLEELQVSLASVLLAIVQRLENGISAQMADNIMEANIEMLKHASHTNVPEVIFQIVSGLANALAGNFQRYMEPFVPYLYNALGNHEAPDMCSLAIGLVSDIVRALETNALPWCNTFMNYLLNALASNKISNQLKPPILETFGDIATSIGPEFETYATTVASVLEQARTVSAAPDVAFDLLDYIVSLRSGIADAWGGMVIAFKATPKVQILQGFVQQIFNFLESIANDGNHNEGLLRACMGLIGYVFESTPLSKIC
jgi:importin subunit beta-1